MLDNVERRCVELGKYIVETKATVRQTAAVFGVSKSTVHKDVTKRLQAVHKAVKAVLEENKAERHIRGGNATREKYRHMKKD